MKQENECKTCGANNDPLFVTCAFCNSALPNIDLNKISDQDLIMNLGEWIGKLDGIDKTHGLKVDLEKSTGLNKLTGDSDSKYIAYGEVIGNIEKYISLLKIRSQQNQNIALTVQQLEKKYNDFKTKAEKKNTRQWIIFGIGIVLFFLIVGVLASKESGNIDNEHLRLQKIETQIEDAIKEQNYDYALILIEKLNWTIDPYKREEEVKIYNDKRENLRNTIIQIKR